MILTLKPSKKNEEGHPTITVESPDNTMTCPEAVEFVAAMLLAWGYQYWNVVDAMAQWAYDREDTDEKEKGDEGLDNL